MRELLTLLCLGLFPLFANAQGKIPNLHSVDPSGQVLRGKEPTGAIDQLSRRQVTDVIIFKIPVKDEVSSEKVLLEEAGIRWHHIPMKWKELDDQQACEQTITALQTIARLKANGRKIYFHCTSGIDRTGMLAGLWRISSQGWTLDRAFKNEMCARGYSDATPYRGDSASLIEDGLTPLFEYLGSKFEDGAAVTKRLCKNIKLVRSRRTCYSQ